MNTQNRVSTLSSFFNVTLGVILEEIDVAFEPLMFGSAFKRPQCTVIGAFESQRAVATIAAARLPVTRALHTTNVSGTLAVGVLENSSTTRFDATAPVTGHVVPFFLLR